MTSVIFFLDLNHHLPTLPEEVGVEATDFVHLFFLCGMLAPGRVPATVGAHV